MILMLLTFYIGNLCSVAKKSESRIERIIGFHGF